MEVEHAVEVRDKVELLPYRDLDDLVQLYIKVEQQLKRKPMSKYYCSHSYPKKDQGQGILEAEPSKPKDNKRDEEGKLEKQKKKKDSKTLSSKDKGKEKNQHRGPSELRMAGAEGSRTERVVGPNGSLYGSLKVAGS